MLVGSEYSSTAYIHLEVGYGGLGIHFIYSAGAADIHGPALRFGEDTAITHFPADRWM